MTTYEEIETLHSKIINMVHHPYLDRFLQSPIIDKNLISAYHAIFRSYTPEFWLENASSAILVHIALDTHETITTLPPQNNEAQTKRQLTVLSGDYYSSLYYYLLSKTENIKLIKWLAKGIQTFNNAKMYLFVSKVHNWTESFRYLYQIETALLSHIIDGLGLQKWGKPLCDLLYLKRLLFEQSAFLSNENSIGYFRFMFEAKDDSRQKAAAVIGDEIGRIEKELQRVIPVLTSQSNLVEQFIHNAFNQYHYQPVGQAEEG